jgi:hypothetical protein
MRAKELTLQGKKLPASKAFSYFLSHQINEHNFTEETLKIFSRLDDYDVFSSIKEWIANDDYILATLSENLINRKLPKVKLQSKNFTTAQIQQIKQKVQHNLNLSEKEVEYFVYAGKIYNQAYDSTKNNIQILYKNGTIKDITEASDHLNIQALSKPVYKYYFCYPKK